MPKILVIDDDKNILELYKIAFSKEGFKVSAADNGKTGLESAKKEIPDLIILDVGMPGMDGGTVKEGILADNRMKNVPIIFLTGMVSAKEVDEAKGRIGGHLYISKSSSISDIVSKVKDVLNKKT